MGANSGEQLAAPGKACGAPDFSAVLVKLDEQSLLSQLERNHSAPVLTNNSPELELGRLNVSPGRWGAHRAPSESKISVPLTTILRI